MKLILSAPKTLKKSQDNLLAKLEKEYGLTVGTETEERRNPYTGIAHTLHPLAVTLLDFILETYSSTHGMGPLSYRGKAVNIQTWDRSRYLFLELWPDEYFDLLD
jgi:hypothetical protein